jgi:amidase
LPLGDSFLQRTGRDPGRLRIGRYREPVIAEGDVHAECIEAYEKASTLLGDLGHEVVDVAAPFGPEAVPMFETVWSVGSALVPVPDDREHRLLPMTRWLRERGQQISGPAFAAGLTGMQSLTRTVVTTWQPYDAILTPTLAQPPAPVGSLRNDADPAADFEAQKRFTPFTAVYNVLGLPAVSLPLHWSADGLPIGVMLAGRPAGEAQLLALAAQIERAADWRAQRPACW